MNDKPVTKSSSNGGSEVKVLELTLWKTIGLGFGTTVVYSFFLSVFVYFVYRIAEAAGWASWYTTVGEWTVLGGIGSTIAIVLAVVVTCLLIWALFATYASPAHATA